MSANLPTSIKIKRVQGDNYPEKFSVIPITGLASATLTVENIGSPAAGALNMSAQTIEFPVETALANAVVGSHDFQIVVTTTSGETRTIVQGKWSVSARKVT